MQHYERTDKNGFSRLIKEWRKGTYDPTFWKAKSNGASGKASHSTSSEASKKNAYCQAFSVQAVEADKLHALHGSRFIFKKSLPLFAWERMVQEFERMHDFVQHKLAKKGKLAFVTGDTEKGVDFLAISPDGRTLHSDLGYGRVMVRNIVLKTGSSFKEFDVLLGP